MANGRSAKASYDVKVGDVLEITFGERTLKIRVLAVQEHVTKAGATELYEVVE
jgi:ribosomal 50S subunit-recycling heat shock protein